MLLFPVATYGTAAKNPPRPREFKALQIKKTRAKEETSSPTCTCAQHLETFTNVTTKVDVLMSCEVDVLPVIKLVNVF